jgi:hypothetical protein
MSEIFLNGEGENIPGHRILDGTDLEIAYNFWGDDLIIRVNKRPVQVKRQIRGFCQGSMQKACGALSAFRPLSSIPEMTTVR